VQPTFVLFWRHGHPAVKSLGFPSFPPPHVEVYRNGHGNASFGNADFVGFVSATGGLFGAVRASVFRTTR
jgi:hypothetical protein